MDYQRSRVTGRVMRPSKMALHSQLVSPPILGTSFLVDLSGDECVHLGLTQDTNPSLLRMVHLTVGRHWTTISLMPRIALALAETIWGHKDHHPRSQQGSRVPMPVLVSPVEISNPPSLLFATTLVTNIDSACRLSRCPFLVRWLLREASCRVAIIADTRVKFDIYPTTESSHPTAALRPLQSQIDCD
ncbi:hypothetical protein BKA70DRAFT_785942 [Coprinopsis sp. MPI-PUGE-AT-0042]|nr:hypothetical protein BKA70DRAFT_785942 [Coprinopsis sp. MPI-PUGE-AT-0042]